MSADAQDGDSLPPTFEDLATTRVCEGCGDRVDGESVDDGECIGCRFWGDDR